MRLNERRGAACVFVRVQSKKAAAEKVVEVVKLGPTVKEGEAVFGVAHIYASFNDTFVVRARGPSLDPPSEVPVATLRFEVVLWAFQLARVFCKADLVHVFLVATIAVQHVTDLSGRETIVRVTGKPLARVTRFCAAVRTRNGEYAECERLRVCFWVLQVA